MAPPHAADPQVAFPDPGSRIPDPRSPIPGPRIRGSQFQDPRSRIHPGFQIPPRLASPLLGAPQAGRLESDKEASHGQVGKIGGGPYTPSDSPSMKLRFNEQ